MYLNVDQTDKTLKKKTDKTLELKKLLQERYQKLIHLESTSNLYEGMKRVLENQQVLNNNIATAAILAECVCRDRNIPTNTVEP